MLYFLFKYELMRITHEVEVEFKTYRHSVYQGKKKYQCGNHFHDISVLYIFFPLNNCKTLDEFSLFICLKQKVY